MDRAGVLGQIFPEIEACRRTAVRYYGSGGVLKHSFETVDNLEWILKHDLSPAAGEYLEQLVGGYPRRAWLKWAAFLHDIGKPATAKMFKGRLRFFEHEHVGAELTLQIGKRLRLSRQETQLLAMWVRHHMRTGSLAAAPRITDKALSRFFRDLGEEGVGMVLLSLADHYTYLKRSLWGKGKDPVEKMGKRLLTTYFEERSKILPEKVIDGHELMKALRIPPGPKVGKLLAAVQDAQAEGKVRTKEEALQFLKKTFKK
jgi:putative nucleotidyltransferase with HDIG domain